MAFTDEVTTADVHDVVAAAHGRCAAIPPVTVSVGPLAGSAGAVRFSVGPHHPIRQIRAATQAAIVEVLGSQALPTPATPFVPHVSIAYNNTPANAQPVIEQVAALRPLGTVTVEVRAIDLVELRRDGATYAWSPFATVPLTGHTG